MLEVVKKKLHNRNSVDLKKKKQPQKTLQYLDSSLYRWPRFCGKLF